MLTGSSPMPIKGRLLPQLGSGQARVTLKFAVQSSLTLGREDCSPLSLTASLAVPHLPGFTPIASGQERAVEGPGPAASYPALGHLGLLWSPSVERVGPHGAALNCQQCPGRS